MYLIHMLYIYSDIEIENEYICNWVVEGRATCHISINCQMGIGGNLTDIFLNPSSYALSSCFFPLKIR